jgi:hypothetical protein
VSFAISFFVKPAVSPIRPARSSPLAALVVQPGIHRASRTPSKAPSSPLKGHASPSLFKTGTLRKGQMDEQRILYIVVDLIKQG